MVVTRLTPQILQGLEVKSAEKELSHITIKNHRNLKERWKKMLSAAGRIPAPGTEGYDDMGEAAATSIVHDIMQAQKQRLVNIYLEAPFLKFPVPVWDATAGIAKTRVGKGWQGVARDGKGWQGVGKGWQGVGTGWQGVGKAWHGLARVGKG